MTAKGRREDEDKLRTCADGVGDHDLEHRVRPARRATGGGPGESAEADRMEWRWRHAPVHARAALVEDPDERRREHDVPGHLDRASHRGEPLRCALGSARMPACGGSGRTENCNASTKRAILNLEMQT